MKPTENKTMRQKEVAILGSTGSIGTQTLDIIKEYPERFRAGVLTARSNWRMLAEQALEFKPRRVVIAKEEYYSPLREALSGRGIDVAAGEKAIAEAAAEEYTDTVVTAVVGYSGLLPTIEAVKAGKTIALANKETLVAGGSLITRMLRDSEASIVPVDSEHSAIFQCLVGETTRQARKILLTASGGPFRTFGREQLENVTPADALRHPNWSMGAKVTIDSASMMNKGFEMMEARWLFGCPPEKIEVLVHPQSVVHSMVEFYDGSVKAQLGVPDMHLPIRYALGYPERLPSEAPPLSFEQYTTLTFERPDLEKFPLLGMAYEAIGRGGNMPCILNAANEVAVAAFLKGELKFTRMPELAAQTMEACTFVGDPELADLVTTHSEATRIAEEKLCGLKGK